MLRTVGWLNHLPTLGVDRADRAVVRASADIYQCSASPKNEFNYSTYIKDKTEDSEGRPFSLVSMFLHIDRLKQTDY